jgi:predicted  nucleic acid-binding Zn-ribbon protein
MPAAEIAAYSAEKEILVQNNRRLREENADLRDEVEEMKAMIELLKAQVSGRRGLVSDPRGSPQISPSSLTSSMRLERPE